MAKTKTQRNRVKELNEEIQNARKAMERAKARGSTKVFAEQSKIIEKAHRELALIIATQKV